MGSTGGEIVGFVNSMIDCDEIATRGLLGSDCKNALGRDQLNESVKPVRILSLGWRGQFEKSRVGEV